MDGHTPVVIDDFLGHYARGLNNDVPKNYFIDTLNLRFSTGEVRSREGSSLNLSINNVVRFFPYKRLNENPRYLILNTSGQVFDSVVSLTVPIFTDATWVDFSVFCYDNLAFLTGHNRIKGITSRNIQVYDGSTVRPAGGAAPTGFTLTATDSASSGNVEAGIHIFAVSFETSSGFITPPGPAIFPVYTAPGGLKVTIGSIPIGPTGTVARRILATQVIPVYNGNQIGYEFFFIPTGRIADNTTTSIDLSFFDQDLVQSADYLFDQFALLPCGLGMCDYNGRIALWGVPGSEHIVFMSTAGQPESFDQINGFLTIRPSDAQTGVLGCWANRGTLYSRKANGTYYSVDNQQDPVTWITDRVDIGIGGEVFAGCSILDQEGVSTDKYFVAHISGLYLFNTNYQKPEVSWNIKDLWKRINKTVFNLVQVVHDPCSYSIYITVPLDASNVISHIFYCDYSEGVNILGYIDPFKCKWSIWQLQGTGHSILCDFDVNTKEVIFKYSVETGSIYNFDDTINEDFGNKITSYGTLYLASAKDIGLPDDESVLHFGGVRIRVTGSGTLILTCSDESGAQIINPPSLTLGNIAALFRQFNFSNERMSLQFKVDNAGDFFTASRVVLFANKEADERPQS